MKTNMKTGLEGLKQRAMKEQQEREELKLNNDTTETTPNTDEKIWAKSHVRTNLVYKGFLAESEVGKYTTVPSVNVTEEPKEEKSMLSVHKYERYTVERLYGYTTNKDYEGVDIEEVPDIHVTVVFKVIAVQEGVETKVKVGKTYKLGLIMFNSKFTELGDDYCTCCKRPISKKNMDYLTRALDNEFLGEEYKQLIRKMDSKLCIHCQCIENINFETLFINIFDNETKNAVSIYNAIKGANIAKKEAYGTTQELQFAFCECCKEKRVVRISEFSAYAKLYQTQLEEAGKSDMFLCNHCLSKVIKVEDNTNGVSNLNFANYTNSLSKEDKKRYESEVNGILNSINNVKDRLANK